MMERTFTAMYGLQSEAEAARDALVGIGVPSDGIAIRGAEAGAATTTARTEDKGLWESLKDLFHIFAEGLQRGGYLLSARVPEGLEDQATDVLERSGAKAWKAWEDRVRARAQAIWEREGRPEGSAERHWAQAEEELRSEGRGRGEAPAAEAAQTAGEAERATGAEGEGEQQRREPVVTEGSPPAGQHGPGQASATEAVRTARRAERAKPGTKKS